MFSIVIIDPQTWESIPQTLSADEARHLFLFAARRVVVQTYVTRNGKTRLKKQVLKPRQAAAQLDPNADYFVYNFNPDGV